MNLSQQYRSIAPDIDQALDMVKLSGYYSEGPEVGIFENNFAREHEALHCIALNSGTSSLVAILSALGINQGNEVIIPANTCFATAESVCLSGATPVFVDCEDQFFNMDPGSIEKAISKNTKAIIAVHLYGQPAQMSEIKKIAESSDLFLIEDCAQAHLARHRDQPVGNFGIAGAFSFYPTKNLGAYGEAGAVITNNGSLADRIRALKNHGSPKKNIHDFIGNNYRMSTMHAAILSAKLKHLEQWTTIRKKNADLYNTYLADVPGITLPKQQPGSSHVFHLYVIRTTDRNRLQEYLRYHGIETAIHYPIPCHLQPALQHLSYKKGSFPVAEQMSNQILSLPVAEHLKDHEIRYISGCVMDFFENMQSTRITNTSH